MFKIIRREEMAEGTVILNEIEAPMIARKAKPGQFVILKANETGERIPLTMAETDSDKGTITVIYMVVGKSTALFKTLLVGDGYQDVIGPLGKPTDVEKVGNVVCVGGGTGIAVLHPITRALKALPFATTHQDGSDGEDIGWRKECVPERCARWYTGGRALDVNTATLRIGESECSKSFQPTDKAVTFEMELTAGPAHLQTVLSNEKGAAVGAYYVYVRRIDYAKA